MFIGYQVKVKKSFIKHFLENNYLGAKAQRVWQKAMKNGKEQSYQCLLKSKRFKGAGILGLF